MSGHRNALSVLLQVSHGDAYREVNRFGHALEKTEGDLYSKKIVETAAKMVKAKIAKGQTKTYRKSGRTVSNTMLKTSKLLRRARKKFMKKTANALSSTLRKYAKRIVYRPNTKK